MRKLFRFKYEECNGTCYCWCDLLPEELLRMPEDIREETVRLMVRGHAALCDNPDYSFGIDMDDKTKLFVAHFITPSNTELFSSLEFSECVKMVCSKVLSTDIPKAEGNCTYGDNGAEDLGREILKACSDVVFRKEHHDSCPCVVTNLEDEYNAKRAASVEF